MRSPETSVEQVDPTTLTQAVVIERLGELPPSAKLVYKVLEYNGTLTQREISNRSLLPGRTTRYALNQLREVGLVREHIDFRDARRRLYTVPTFDQDAD